MSGKPGILIVDDDPDIRGTLLLVLENNGYEAKTASNGEEALKALEDWHPELIILDIMMDTETEGFEVAYKIRNDCRLSEIPIVMLTSFLDKMRKEGPEQFLDILEEEWPATWLFEKPVDTKKLLEKIGSILSPG